MITEPNGNRSQFAFSPLGLLQRTAVMGKEGGTDEGDDIDTAPGTRLEYDFLAYHNAQQPVWVKTIKREYHIHDGDIPAGANPNATITTVEYTDGFGRLLQTRTQAEDVLFGDGLFGDSGLPAEQGTNANAIGIQRPATALPNVVVSGWQVYNNKGKVVEQYEPYFDRGFQYTAPFNNATLQSAIQGGVMVQMYYDPRGQVVRTVNPDATEQWVLFGKPQNITSVTLNELGLPVPSSPPSQGGVPAGGGGQGGATPWESYTFDANDLAPRTHPSGSGVPATHHWTPSSSLLDPLGRTIKTVDRNGAAEADEVVMQYEFDIRGNLLKVTDALGRIAFTYVYDLKPKGKSEEDQGANILTIQHLDSGSRIALFDAAYRPTELRDAKGSLILHGYDELNRPIRVWARDNVGEDVTFRQKLIYGDDTTDGPSTPIDTNHLGKLFKHFDEAGLVTLEEYDFKGNVLQKKREVIADSEIKAVFDGPPTDWDVPTYRVDWDGNPALEGEYITDMEYDALNRMKKMVYPEDQDTERKELVPTYNNAGALEKVTMDGNTYMEHIAYNAKGQRLLIAFGNGVMTRYTYNTETFRLSRMKSEKYTRSGWTFEYDSGTNRLDIALEEDLNGNILRRKERRTDCGITGSQLGADALDRNFSYDPLNRLLQATGRESDTQNQNDYLYSDAPAPGNPNANNVRGYTRNYVYDKVGNIQSMAHSASGNSFTRIFNYQTGKNRLEKIETGSAVTIEDYMYDSNGNQQAAGTTRNYEWDHSDQLRCYYNQAGIAAPTIYAHYLYDAAGNRVKKLVRTSSTNWEATVYIDGVFEYHKKETASNTYQKNYLHVMDDKSMTAQRRVGTSFPDDITEDTFYVLDDHLSSSNVRLDDSTGAVIDREEYYPFGDSSLRTFSKKRYRYVGKEKDHESGLYYYGARYYAAWTCRFISVDALAWKYAQLTPYNYSDNNPINDRDIDGNQNKNSSESVKGGTKLPVNKETGMPMASLPVVTVAAKAKETFQSKAEKTYWALREGNAGNAKMSEWELNDTEKAEMYDSFGELNELGRTVNNIGLQQLFLEERSENGLAGKFFEAAFKTGGLNNFEIGEMSQVREEVYVALKNEYLKGIMSEESLGTIIGFSLFSASAGMREAGKRTIQVLSPPAATTTRGILARFSGILRDAAKFKGNHGLGKATAKEAMELGKAWVGKGATLASDGKTLVSADKLRQFRPPSFKPRLGVKQANFEWRNSTEGAWQGNGHLDIVF